MRGGSRGGGKGTLLPVGLNLFQLHTFACANSCTLLLVPTVAHFCLCQQLHTFACANSCTLLLVPTVAHFCLCQKRPLQMIRKRKCYLTGTKQLTQLTLFAARPLTKTG